MAGTDSHIQLQPGVKTAGCIMRAMQAASGLTMATTRWSSCGWRGAAAVVVSELPIRLRLAAAEWFSQLLRRWTMPGPRFWPRAAYRGRIVGTLASCADPGRTVCAGRPGEMAGGRLLITRRVREDGNGFRRSGRWVLYLSRIGFTPALDAATKP